MRQREPRQPVLVKARMRDGAEWGDVVIHNMSSRGLLGSCSRPLRPGTVVEIRRVHHVVVGRVVWSSEDRFGVRTQDRIDIDGIVNAKPPARPPVGAPTDERRSDARPVTAADIAARKERSQTWARLFQFTLLTGAAGGAAALIAWQVSDLLGRSMTPIVEALGGAAR